MQCSTCFEFGDVVWMEWNDGGQEKKNASEGE